MSYVEWKNLTAQQRLEVFNLRPAMHPSDFVKFAFWIKPDGHVSRRGGHHELTEEGYQAKIAKYYGEVRTKGDLREWKPGVIFHFDRSPA